MADWDSNIVKQELGDEIETDSKNPSWKTNVEATPEFKPAKVEAEDIFPPVRTPHLFRHQIAGSW